MAKRGQPLQIRQAHLPQMAAIDAYGNGGFRFAEMSHRGSLLCVPSGIHGWEPVSFEDVDLDSFAPVLEQSDDIEILIVGTGTDLIPLPEEWKAEFRSHGIMADPMSTGNAVRTYNVLFNENRAVAAVFLAVE
ncbi:hypothetical protein E1162_01310 [Rhodobacteraceae bacterium RKSG542]|uniref:Mth938-like domain-containing protein n=1 Tax=Pseudovibrio flavus TaxID=2529854 RepID=UPI0012BD3366|nr:Mth938-like domain-containing protein [Pseudovibrio flavus]MTI15871.1 hypothetical protein [Pseudovibrio flavus]